MIYNPTEYPTYKSSCIFDFSKIDVFSIERTLDIDGYAYTCIGYLTGDKEIHEWFLYCSNKRHEELVQEYLEVKNQLTS